MILLGAIVNALGVFAGGIIGIFMKRVCLRDSVIL